jgi:hypothetical protein
MRDASDTTDRDLEKATAEFLVLLSIINKDAGSHRLRKAKAEKIAREMLAALKGSNK